MLECKAADWVAISDIGALGHYAVQYAKAMGFHVIAVDIDDAELAVATRLGADMVINARVQDPSAELQRAIRGAHGVLMTAVARTAFAQALGVLHRRGTMSLVGLPPGDFALPTSCLMPRLSAARSLALAWTSRKRSPSPARARFAASTARTGSTTSTPFSRA